MDNVVVFAKQILSQNIPNLQFLDRSHFIPLKTVFPFQTESREFFLYF